MKVKSTIIVLTILLASLSSTLGGFIGQTYQNGLLGILKARPIAPQEREYVVKFVNDVLKKACPALDQVITKQNAVFYLQNQLPQCFQKVSHAHGFQSFLHNAFNPFRAALLAESHVSFTAKKLKTKSHIPKRSAKYNSYLI